MEKKTAEEIAEEIMRDFGIALGKAREEWAERLMEEAKLEQMLKEAEEAVIDGEGWIGHDELKERLAK